MQTIEFYKTLQENGAPVRILADPKAGRGPDDPAGAIAWPDAMAAWFAEYGGISIPDAKHP